MYDIGMQPQTPSTGDPYDFITNPSKPAKKSLFGGGPKLLPIVALAAIIVVVLVIGVSLLSGGGSLKKDYTTLLQQQTEILRISDLGLKNARSSDARNFAVITKESIYSQQGTLTKQAASVAKVKLKAKELSAGKNADTDKKLTAGEQTNKYDEVLVGVLQDSLKQYQQTLKKIYDQTNKKTAKDNLDEAYASVQVLINASAQGAKSGATDGTPATN